MGNSCVFNSGSILCIKHISSVYLEGELLKETLALLWNLQGVALWVTCIGHTPCGSQVWLENVVLPAYKDGDLMYLGAKSVLGGHEQNSGWHMCP